MYVKYSVKCEGIDLKFLLGYSTKYKHNQLHVLKISKVKEADLVRRIITFRVV